MSGEDRSETLREAASHERLRVEAPPEQQLLLIFAKTETEKKLEMGKRKVSRTYPRRNKPQ